MTDLDRRKPDAGDAQLAFTLDNYRELVKRPLLALPVALRRDVLDVWACHKHLSGLESALPIAGALAVWMRRYGLTIDDAADSLVAMTSPERMGGFRFASDLMTELAKAVSAKIAYRKTLAEQQERLCGRRAGRGGSSTDRDAEATSTSTPDRHFADRLNHQRERNDDATSATDREHPDRPERRLRRPRHRPGACHHQP